LEKGGSFRQSLSDRFRTGQIRKSIMVEQRKTIAQAQARAQVENQMIEQEETKTKMQDV